LADGFLGLVVPLFTGGSTAVTFIARVGFFTFMQIFFHFIEAVDGGSQKSIFT
jgi:hypothetical protein